MNHKHVKKWHCRSLQHDFWEQFSKHELHSGDWVQIAKRWHVLFSCFSFFIFFFFWRKNVKIWKIMKNVSIFREKKDIIYALQGVFLAWCAAENSTILCALAFWIPESCVVSCALSFQFQRSPMSSSANGPLARTAKRHREINPMMAGMNPFLASMFGPAFALLVPTRAESCWFCFDGSMRYVATRDQKRHWFLMCLFCQLLSDRVASVVKTKSVLIGFSLNRLNRMK